MDAFCKGRGNDSMGAASWLQFRKKSAWIWLQISVQGTSPSATIGPRSGHDRGPESSSIVVSSSRNDSAAKDVQSRLDRVVIAARSCRDRGSIKPQSWSSSTTPPRRPIDLQVTGGSRSRDRDPHSSSVRWRSNRADETRRHLS